MRGTGERCAGTPSLVLVCGMLLRRVWYWKVLSCYDVSGTDAGSVGLQVQGGEGVGGDRCRANRQAAARLRSVGVRYAKSLFICYYIIIYVIVCL